jgi:hypothetical protein
MTKYLAIAFLITGFLVGDAYGDDLIADLHFDDGSVLHNVKITNNVVHFKHEGDNYDFGYQDLKSISFDVQPGTSDVTRCAWPYPEETLALGIKEKCGTIGKEAIVTLKIKTKIGVEAIDRFSTGGSINDRGCSGLAHKHKVKVISKLTGKKITRTYGVTNIKTSRLEATFYDVLGHDYTQNSPLGCVFHKGKRKAISSIIFKDGNEKIEGIKK